MKFLISDVYRITECWVNCFRAVANFSWNPLGFETTTENSNFTMSIDIYAQSRAILLSIELSAESDTGRTGAGQGEQNAVDTCAGERSVLSYSDDLFRFSLRRCEDRLDLGSTRFFDLAI
jgi:hypothetical protein